VTVSPNPNGLYRARNVRFVTPDIGARTIGGQMLIEPISSGLTAFAGGVTVADCTTEAANGANVTQTPKTTLFDLFLGFMNIGLTSVGGAAGPLRHVIVKKRAWLSEKELAELFGIAQALPGATGSNIAVMLGDRLCGAAGPFAALAGLVIPSLLIAIAIAGFAEHLAAVNTRFAAAETCVTAAVGGIFISNGIRLGRLIWGDAPDVRIAWRSARLSVAALGVLLVAVFHLFVPIAMVILISLSMLVETRLRVLGNAA
jgi:chromate transporter